MRYILAPALALLAMASPASACPHTTAQQVAFGVTTCAACAAPVQQGFSAAYGDPGVAPVGLPVQTQTTTTTTQQVVQQPYTQVQQSVSYSQPQQVVVQAPVVYAAPIVFAAPVYAQTYGVGYGGGFNTFGGSYGVRSFGGYNTFGNGFGGYGGAGYGGGFGFNRGIGFGVGHVGGFGSGIHHGGVGFSAGFHGGHR